MAPASASDLHSCRYEGHRRHAVGMGCGQRLSLFPTIKDETFGYILHPVDLATNRAMAAAGSRELRDIVDLVTIHETILPVGLLHGRR